MKLERRRTVLAAILLTLLGGTYVLAGQDQVDGFKIHRLREKVAYLESPRGGNIGVSAGEDGVLLIDDQFLDIAPELEERLRELSQEKPAYLINTHHHGDHTSGNAYFGSLATIFAHANVRARLQANGDPAQALPEVTYDEGISIHFNGEEIRLVHVPGAHTDGDTVVWFTGSKVVHMGDLYFQVGYPYIDTGSGGNALGLAEGLRRVLRMVPDDVIFIPGHGESTDAAGLLEYTEMIETITDSVRQHLDQGHSVDQMLEAGVTADYDERWGGFQFVPPRRFLESVVASLR